MTLYNLVTPAKAGVYQLEIPAFAGMTVTAHISLADQPSTRLQPSDSEELYKKQTILPVKYEQLRMTGINAFHT